MGNKTARQPFPFPTTSQGDDMANGTTRLRGITVERTGDGFLIHLADDADEVFEIRASAETVELMVSELQMALAAGAEGSPSE
ncbi:hypothetical protein C9E82_16955 [Paracoccus siganidrum]|uniref:Uncharacterized protein n=2 Tax=Paracoccus siganidrum TaxID=1276757 RepID=A0A419AC10_9RHOB|nr:hypothetical protein D3P05_01240 [Paracoccus siganidrum]RMC30939.1 hypothetical protein C9E82_16955 [Paracoccus siganidrum]